MLKLKSFIIILSFALLFSNCYKEHSIKPTMNEQGFNIVMDESVEQMVNKIPGQKFYLNPDPILYYNGQPYATNSMATRGQGSLKYKRKSFSVNLENNISFEKFAERKFEKFKLIAMVYDYTYTENILAHQFLKKAELWPLSTFLTQVKLNGNHNGIYLFIEDPEEFVYTHFNAETIIRRDYNAGISAIKTNSDITKHSEFFYKKEFKNLYSIITKYKGEELYNILVNKINLQSYFRKMAIDYILKNADSTDEVYFYGTTTNNGVFFNIIPWDYDDLFGSKPHEIDNKPDIGTAFGKRQYNSYDELLDFLEGKFIFSIEDDLDYIIATDDYLYSKYLTEFKNVVELFPQSEIEQMFDTIKYQLDPFYAIPEVIAQSEYDQSTTSLEKYNNNIVAKEKLLVERLNWIKTELK